MFNRYNPNKCYVIAEIGGNFTNFTQAKRIIDLARDCGVDAIKLQTYKADTVASKEAIFEMENTGRVSQYELFKKLELSKKDHIDVFRYAQNLGLDWFSSPSHKQDVDFLDSMGVGLFKIGSDDAVNLPFLEYVARKNKPVILSTGMCTLDEVRGSVDVIYSTGNRQLILLHAITAYPTHPEDVNLRAIQTMQSEFPEIAIGYSDHTLGIMACLGAVALGAKVIEKHFTYDKAADGPDHLLSADPKEMTELVAGIKEMEILLGTGKKMPAKSEENSIINNRKSIILSCSLKKGSALKREHLDIKRPGYGIPPKELGDIIGKVLNKDKLEDSVLLRDDII